MLAQQIISICRAGTEVQVREHIEASYRICARFEGVLDARGPGSSNETCLDRFRRSFALNPFSKLANHLFRRHYWHTSFMASGRIRLVSIESVDAARLVFCVPCVVEIEGKSELGT